MAHIPPFDAQQMQAIAKALAPTEDGLTGAQIGHLLAECKIPDVTLDNTKWERLHNAFAAFQNKRDFGNHVIVFINRVMSPVLFTQDHARFERWRDRLNTVLAFSGYTVGDDGRVRTTNKATNLDEAMAKAQRLQRQLESRGVHPDVLHFCKAEWLQENYFHAVFEATKSIAAKVRNLTGLTGDGTQLIQDAFSGAAPAIAINALISESDRSEQKGFVNLLTGIFGTVRNPLAHNPKVDWVMNEQDALDILTLVSLVHRKIDQRTRP